MIHERLNKYCGSLCSLFDLMLLFGLAIFGLYSLRGKERVSGTVLNFESLLYGTSVAGVALSLASMLLLAKAMSVCRAYGATSPYF
jgi:putative copper export protein